MLKLEHRAIGPGGGHTAGRTLLKEMVESLSHAPMPEILIAGRGKPYFKTGGLHFSISHTKGHVFCALSDRPIGIDAEELDRDISLKLAQKILSLGELAQYEQAADKRLALLTFWVLKEAQGKCAGAGINGYPNHTDFSLGDPRVTQTAGCLLAVIQEDDDAL